MFFRSGSAWRIEAGLREPRQSEHQKGNIYEMWGDGLPTQPSSSLVMWHWSVVLFWADQYYVDPPLPNRIKFQDIPVVWSTWMVREPYLEWWLSSPQVAHRSQRLGNHLIHHEEGMASASVASKAHYGEPRSIFHHHVLWMPISISRSDNTNLSCCSV